MSYFKPIDHWPDYIYYIDEDTVNPSFTTPN